MTVHHPPATSWYCTPDFNLGVVGQPVGWPFALGSTGMGEGEGKRGFFRRLLSQALPPPQVIIPKGTVRHMISGGSYYPEGHRPLRVGPETVEFRCEPDNQWDANAVMVLARGRQVGYLGSFHAANYQPIIAKLQAEGSVGHVAEVTKTHDGLGVVVHLPPFDWLDVWAATDPAHRASIPFNPRRVNIKRLGDYQDQLASILDGRDWERVVANVSGYEQPSGKWKGQTSLRFEVEGVEIGLLPAQYGNEARTLVWRVENFGPQRVLVEVKRWDEVQPLSARFWQYDDLAAAD